MKCKQPEMQYNSSTVAININKQKKIETPKHTQYYWKNKSRDRETEKTTTLQNSN